MTTLAAHRLTLSAAEYRYLVTQLGLSMPPGWVPGVATGVVPADLAERGVLRGDPPEVHPSVKINLETLAHPRIMLDTTATIGDEGLHSVHAVAGSLGASLFALADGGVELSLFAATDLGRELIRAVPDAPDGSGAPSGRLPVAALQELGLASLSQDADPHAVQEVLATLRLSAAEGELAARVAGAANGGLVCAITARVGDAVRSGRVIWVHADGGWVGIQPDPDSSGRRMVRLEPVAREDLGVWVAPYVAEALGDG
jgi:ESAT-6 protein secretion system EspG family protein